MDSTITDSAQARTLGSSVLDWKIEAVPDQSKGYMETIEIDESSVHSKLISKLYCRSVCAEFRRPVVTSYPELAATYNSIVRFPVDLGTLLFRCVMKEKCIDDTPASKNHQTCTIDQKTNKAQVIAGNLDDDLRNALHRLCFNSIRFNEDIPMLNAVAHHVRDYACGLYEEAIKKPFHLDTNSNTYLNRFDLLGGIIRIPGKGFEKEQDSVLGMSPVTTDIQCKSRLPVFFSRLLHNRRQRWLLCHKEPLLDDELEEVRVNVIKSKQAFEMSISHNRGWQAQSVSIVDFFDAAIQALTKVLDDIASHASVTSTTVNATDDCSREATKEGSIDSKSRLETALQSALINIFGTAFYQHLYPNFSGTPKSVNADGSDMPAILSMMTLCQGNDTGGITNRKNNVYFSHSQPHQILTNIDSLLLRADPSTPYTYDSTSQSGASSNSDTHSLASVDYLINFAPSSLCVQALRCLDENMGMTLVSIEERLKRGSTASTIWARPLDCAVGTMPSTTRKFPVILLAGGPGTTISKCASQANLMRLPPKTLADLIKYKPGWNSKKKGGSGIIYSTSGDTVNVSGIGIEANQAGLSDSKLSSSLNIPANGLPISVPTPPDLVWHIPHGYYLAEFLDTREFGWMEAKSIKPYFGRFPTESSKKETKTGMRSKLFDAYKFIQHNTFSFALTTDTLMQSLAPGEATLGDTDLDAPNSIERDISLPTLEELKKSIEIPGHVLLKIKQADPTAVMAAADPSANANVEEKKKILKKRKEPSGGKESREMEAISDSLIETVKLKLFRACDHLTRDFSYLRPSIDAPSAASFVCGEGVVHTKSIDRSHPLFFMESKKRDTRKAVLRSQLEKLNNDLKEVMMKKGTATTTSTSGATIATGTTTICVDGDGQVMSAAHQSPDKVSEDSGAVEAL